MKFFMIIITLVRLLFAAIALLIHYPFWQVEKWFKELTFYSWQRNLKTGSMGWGFLYYLSYHLKWLISWPTKFFSGFSSILIPNGKD